MSGADSLMDPRLSVEPSLSENPTSEKATAAPVLSLPTQCRSRYYSWTLHFRSRANPETSCILQPGTRRDFIKGPSLKIDLRVLRVWKCGSCGRTVRTPGNATSRICGCSSSPVFMALMDQREKPVFDVQQFISPDDPNADADDDAPDGLEEATAAVLEAIRLRVEAAAAPPRTDYAAGFDELADVSHAEANDPARGDSQSPDSERPSGSNSDRPSYGRRRDGRGGPGRIDSAGTSRPRPDQRSRPTSGDAAAGRQSPSGRPSANDNRPARGRDRSGRPERSSEQTRSQRNPNAPRSESSLRADASRPMRDDSGTQDERLSESAKPGNSESADRSVSEEFGEGIVSESTGQKKPRLRRRRRRGSQSEERSEQPSDHGGSAENSAGHARDADSFSGEDSASDSAVDESDRSAGDDGSETTTEASPGMPRKRRRNRKRNRNRGGRPSESDSPPVTDSPTE